ncbi:GntR family transcriptional regulator [Phytoactinopolyspora halotolerans]|uniref:Winged helix-turn-helix transcriptional regulator n=1 Tax=Phytoactinopolyspora halotolerans TaxID=1981512 RepID=A0A6L9S831_9ACTN|nr:winged helix-turn-helix domain-containing protein [Phytoactinopolyspora halotolerans]NEE01163.1 winged helix-turn-helix transcriptional regulator [Phytoactinopolyspora halotolerans]
MTGEHDQQSWRDALTEWERIDTPGYLYLQAADFIAERIESGILPRGARLPGEKDFALMLDVSIGTIRRATDELRERGLVITLPAKGNFIATPRDRARGGQHRSAEAVCTHDPSINTIGR